MNTARAHDGTNIAYTALGEGEPVLLLSGQAQDHHIWDRFAPLLASNHQVILLDYRGTGESDKPNTSYSTELFADDAVAVLNSLSIKKSHALGFSMGGKVCQWLGTKHRNRIGSLILAATTPGSKHEIARSEKVTEILKSGNLESLAELVYSQEYLSTHKDYFMKYISSIPEFARGLHFWASQNHDAWEFLHTITCSTLILHGSDDVFNPTRNATILAGAIPNSKEVIVDRGRHGFLDEFSERCDQIILDYFEENPINTEIA